MRQTAPEAWGQPSAIRTFVYGSAPENIFLTIYQGRPNGMPAWGGVLPDTIIWDLVTYIGNLSNEPDTQWGTTVSLNPQNPNYRASSGRARHHGPNPGHKPNPSSPAKNRRPLRSDDGRCVSDAEFIAKYRPCWAASDAAKSGYRREGIHVIKAGSWTTLIAGAASQTARAHRLSYLDGPWLRAAYPIADAHMGYAHYR